MSATPIADAPAWLSAAVSGQPCSGCGSARTGYVGVYVRPMRPRIAYAVCGLCVANLEHVAERVERRVAACELCTVAGGVA